MSTAKETPKKDPFYGFQFGFELVGTETFDQWKGLLCSLLNEHNPQSVTERILVQKMAEHHWLVLRGRRFQDDLICSPDIQTSAGMRQMNLWMRYEAQHERAFHKAASELRKWKEEKRKAEIGFEREKRAQAENARKQEAHETKTRLAKAKAEAIEIDTEVKTMMQAPIPGMPVINFEDLKAAVKAGIVHQVDARKTGSAA
jgi:ATPase subunit of ABC transporter with duplicated ATPase domains